MAEIPEYERRNVPKTIDNLGIQTSIDFARAEKQRREFEKYKRPEKVLPGERETIQKTPTKSEELLGEMAQGRFALLPPRREVKTKIMALQEGRLSASIGDGKMLQEKIKNAPEKLKNDPNFSKMKELARVYRELDNDCSYIEGHSKQYNKG